MEKSLNASEEEWEYNLFKKCLPETYNKPKELEEPKNTSDESIDYRYHRNQMASILWCSGASISWSSWGVKIYCIEMRKIQSFPWPDHPCHRFLAYILCSCQPHHCPSYNHALENLTWHTDSIHWCFACLCPLHRADLDLPLICKDSYSRRHSHLSRPITVEKLNWVCNETNWIELFKTQKKT